MPISDMALQPAIFQSTKTPKQNLFGYLNTLSTKFNLGSLHYPSKFNFFINKSLRACLPSKQDNRPLAHFPATIWGDRFSHLDFNHSVSIHYFINFI